MMALVRYWMTSHSVGIATPKTQFFIGLHETSGQSLLATSTLPDVGQTSQLFLVLMQKLGCPCHQKVDSELGGPCLSLHHADNTPTHQTLLIRRSKAHPVSFYVVGECWTAIFIIILPT